MKKLLFITLLLLPLLINAQGYGDYPYDKPTKQKQATGYNPTTAAADYLLQSAKSDKGSMWMMGSTVLCFSLGTYMYSQGNSPAFLYILGTGSFVGIIAFRIDAINKKEKAAKALRHYQKQHDNTSLNLGITPNGVGFVYNF